MKTRSLLVGTFLFLWFATFAGAAQELTTSSHVSVEITTTKKIYSRGELIEFRVLLINKGTEPFWLSKSFSALGGGTAGFIINVKQLTGKRAKLACGIAGDRCPGTTSRSPEQTLKEDFLYLPPGGMIGYQDHYRDCSVVNPGRYQISADYVAGDLNQGKVASLKMNGAGVLQIGTYHSETILFTVQ
jgi:hypothetical protein